MVWQMAPSEGTRWRECCASVSLRASLLPMIGFFVLAAIVQLNDPDALLWMCVYLLPALITFIPLLSLKALQSSVWWFCAASTLVAYAAFSFTFITSAAETERLSWNMVSSEEGRESCGLIIIMLWLLFLLCIGSDKLKPCIVGNAWVTASALLASLFPLLCWISYKIYWLMHCCLPEQHCTGIL